MTSNAPLEGRPATQEARILAANEALYAAFNARSLEAMDACWARSAAVACVHPGWSALIGREAVMASWAAILGNPDQPRIVAGAARAFVFERLGYVLCHELVAGSPLAATNVFTLEDGAWRLVHHHSSAVGFMAPDTPDIEVD